jgi:nucleoside-diphosphate-sugar epimerase
VSQKLYLTEDMVGPPYDADNMYGWAKLMAEMTLRAYYKDYGMKSANCRYFTVYGPRGKEDHAVMAMIGRGFLSKNPFEVWGDGTPLREFIFSKDVANIVDLLLEKYEGTDPVIISNSTEYTIKQVVDLIVEHLGFDGEVKWLTDKPNGQYRKPSSNKKLLSIIGEYNFTTLEIGLKESIDWFILNYPKIRK